MRPGSAFGERLAKLRAERWITQGELAERIGWSQRAISAYETVAEYPPTVVVVESAQALSVSPDELLGLKPPPQGPEQPGGPRGPPPLKEVQQVLSLPEKDRRAVIRLVNSLVAGRTLEERQDVGLIRDAYARIVHATPG